MGYTNYWVPKKLNEEQVPEQFWKDAIKVLDKVLERGVKLADGNGDFEFKSGYDLVNYTVMSDNEIPSIVFNGLGENSCETFCLRFDGELECCKTRREPYDLAVKCILMLAGKYGLLKESEGWSFDGAEIEEEYINANNLMMELELI